ncbi:protease inhibitor I42 family protein [Chloroflexota bacterium]
MSKLKWLIGITLLSLIGGLFVACAAPGQKAWVEVSIDEFNDSQHINQTLEVQTGETFEVRLGSNPTTGFQWFEVADIGNILVVEQLDHVFIGPENEPPLPPGTPGQEVWTFKALKQGSSTIYLEYSRPWEGGEKGEWTFTLDVTVK